MFRFWIIILLLISITVCFAGTTGKLAGKVRDESGKGLAFVNISVMQNGKRITGIQSKENGTYVIINIPPGVYDVRFQLVGFKTADIVNLRIEVDKTTTQNVTMQKGEGELQKVTVDANLSKIIIDDSSSSRRMNMDGVGVSDVSGIVALQSGINSIDGHLHANSGSAQPIDPVSHYPIGSKEDIDYHKYFGCRYIHHYMPPPPPPPRPPYNTEDYAKVIENEYKYSIAEPLSTFSIDVDTACYTNIRRMIEAKQLPQKNYVRIEELLNYFKYDYPQPKDEHPISVYTELGNCPWNNKHKLLHIGLQGKDVDMNKAPNGNLVFLLDVSGSMGDANKLTLVKEAMKLLVKQLRSDDRVSIVTYSTTTHLALPSTSGRYKTEILDAINRLYASGSTAGGAGLELAYKTASENFLREGNNRIILCTDGDFNTGDYSNAAMEQLVTSKRDEGIFLTVLGFGVGNIKDSKMELMADKGNGNYAYIDNLLEAHRVLVQEMGGTLFTIGKDVKLQLEFNPAKVKAYRLIGYENRIMKAEDFNNDRKDAGELGAGKTVTALYEVIPAGSDEKIYDVDSLRYQEENYKDVKLTDEALNNNELLTVKLR